MLRVRLIYRVLALVLLVGLLVACGENLKGTQAAHQSATEATSGLWFDSGDCGEPPEALAKFSAEGVVLISPNTLNHDVKDSPHTGHNGVVVCVLVADTSELRAQGLMGVSDVAGFDGMLFVFEETTRNPFWMKDTPLPLTIGWFDSRGKLVDVAVMEPCMDALDCVVYAPKDPYLYALEIPVDSGVARDLGEGWRLKMSQL